MKKISLSPQKIFISFVSFFSIATFSLSLSAAEDSAFAEKARTRQYAGGADESDLKVQAITASSKKAKAEPNQEATEGF